jgi:two-component system alkaline phosphatase synthesis response regulator PhoP
MAMKEKILVVDDEHDILELLRYNFTRNGYEVIIAANGKTALERLTLNPDLIILDVMMPQMDGYEVCYNIKQSEQHKSIPIIFLTAKTSEADEIRGLNLGASDFVQKPVSINKLIARVKANLRNVERQNDLKASNAIIKNGPIVINREEYSVRIDNRSVELARKEFEILFLLASNPGKVYNREKILNEIWGNQVFVVERTIDVHLVNIRKKLGEFSECIETIKGIGYRLRAM